MRFRSQRVAYYYFVVALLLYGLQIAVGLLSAAKYLGPDPLLHILPFDRAKEILAHLENSNRAEAEPKRRGKKSAKPMPESQKPQLDLL